MKNNITKYKQKCCGCGLCSKKCPQKAISMEENKQGFLYPKVTDNLCIDCGLCIRQCAFNCANADQEKHDNLNMFALKHSDEIRLHSRSGGAFTAITDVILDGHGVVYGCKLIDNRMTIHTKTVTKDTRDKLRGSKYIQSDITGIYEQIKDDLKRGYPIAFVGTPCQVAAVKSFLRKEERENLILIDIVCHGVGSPRVWADYMNYLEQKHKKKIVNVDFRNKKDYGWYSNIETVYFNDERYDSEIFKKMYVSHLIIRKDCSQCPYKSMDRVGDITLGDCWGIREVYPDFDDNKGVSLVLVNTYKGYELFKRVSGVKTLSVNDDRLTQQSPLNQNWILPQKYNKFWRDYYRFGFADAVDRYINYAESIMFKDESPTLLKRMYNKCIRIINTRK